jgi:hypothetical protein
MFTFGNSYGFGLLMHDPTPLAVRLNDAGDEPTLEKTLAQAAPEDLESHLINFPRSRNRHAVRQALARRQAADQRRANQASLQTLRWTQWAVALAAAAGLIALLAWLFPRH